ncbi:C39 family peptidase [Mycolicibacterium vaccae]|uniref:C39 family peptidase n=1 Tax=Mycolicibacterium vaccae TaxID=1810 RepID=UPI003D030D05
MRNILPYDKTRLGQDTGWYCGPATVQTILSGRDVFFTEAEIARETEAEEGNHGWDDKDGTDHIRQVATVLNRRLPGSNYQMVEVPRYLDPAGVDRLFAHIRRSIDAGYGVGVNIVAPPSNRPRGVLGSPSPSYPANRTTWHYFAVMGYDSDARAVWVVDSGFQPREYWLAGDQLATLIVPKGYAYADAEPLASIPDAPPSRPDAAAILSTVMGASVSLDRYRQLLPAVGDALARSGCTSSDRIAMWCAQIGHESVGLKYMRELWGPTSDQLTYQGRMGNDQPGDGRRYLGRGPIQITGKNNYRALSQWAHSKGYAPTPTFFVDQPEQLEAERYAFLGAIWYWTEAQPRLNAYADTRNVDDASRAINSPAWIGTTRQANGIGDRRTRYQRALAMGSELLALTAGAGDWNTIHTELMGQTAMASPQEVGAELVGNADHHVVKIWRNVKDWAAGSSNVRSLQDKVTRLLREWTEAAALPGENYDVGRADGASLGPMGPRNALYRVLFETTFWQPRLPLARLRGKRGNKDTLLGHARDAASYGDVVDRKLDKIAAALDIDLSDVE